VTAIPDETRGERLVAFYTGATESPETLWAQLSASDLPKLWIPKREHLYFLETLPQLGTGKVDLKRLRTLAVQLAGSGATLQA